MGVRGMRKNKRNSADESDSSTRVPRRSERRIPTRATSSETTSQFSSDRNIEIHESVATLLPDEEDEILEKSSSELETPPASDNSSELDSVSQPENPGPSPQVKVPTGSEQRLPPQAGSSIQRTKHTPPTFNDGISASTSSMDSIGPAIVGTFNFLLRLLTQISGSEEKGLLWLIICLLILPFTIIKLILSYPAKIVKVLKEWLTSISYIVIFLQSMLWLVIFALVAYRISSEGSMETKGYWWLSPFGILHREIAPWTENAVLLQLLGIYGLMQMVLNAMQHAFG